MIIIEKEKIGKMDKFVLKILIEFRQFFLSIIHKNNLGIIWHNLSNPMKRDGIEILSICVWRCNTIGSESENKYFFMHIFE